MEHLRLILILIGLVILGLIWLLHKPEGRRSAPGARRREPRIEGQASDKPSDEPSSAPAADRHAGEVAPEPRQTRLPDLGSEFEEVAERPVRREPVLTPPRADAPSEATADAAKPGPAAAIEQAAAAETGALAAGASRVVTLYLRARGPRRISGLSLLDAAIKAGLRFGEMKIFHRRHRGEPRPVFSMANITRPGSFDPSGWNLFETPGVALFMTLPGPVSALDAWDAMLATGQRLSGILEADLLDDAQCLLTRQRIAQIREDMRGFDRQHGLH